MISFILGIFRVFNCTSVTLSTHSQVLTNKSVTSPSVKHFDNYTNLFLLSVFCFFRPYSVFSARQTLTLPFIPLAVYLIHRFFRSLRGSLPYFNKNKSIFHAGCKQKLIEWEEVQACRFMEEKKKSQPWFS